MNKVGRRIITKAAKDILAERKEMIEEEYHAIREKLPGNMAKLTGGYEMRCYWFEVFECVRKIFMVGLPVFFNPGSVEQAVLGLVICFITFGMYTGLRPYVNKKDDTLSQVAQIAIFFSLLAGLMLMTNAESPAIDVILICMLIVPPTLALIFNSPLLSEAKKVYKYKSGKKTPIGRGLDAAQAASVRRLDKTLGIKMPDLTGGDDDGDVKPLPSELKALEGASQGESSTTTEKKKKDDKPITITVENSPQNLPPPGMSRASVAATGAFVGANLDSAAAVRARFGSPLTSGAGSLQVERDETPSPLKEARAAAVTAPAHAHAPNPAQAPAPGPPDYEDDPMHGDVSA